MARPRKNPDTRTKPKTMDKMEPAEAPKPTEAKAMKEKLLTPGQCAARLSVHLQTIYGWTQNGWLPYIRLGPKLIRISLDDLQEFIKTRRPDLTYFEEDYPAEES